MSSAPAPAAKTAVTNARLLAARSPSTTGTREQQRKADADQREDRQELRADVCRGGVERRQFWLHAAGTDPILDPPKASCQPLYARMFTPSSASSMRSPGRLPRSAPVTPRSIRSDLVVAALHDTPANARKKDRITSSSRNGLTRRAPARRPARQGSRAVGPCHLSRPDRRERRGDPGGAGRPAPSPPGTRRARGPRCGPGRSGGREVHHGDDRAPGELFGVYRSVSRPEDRRVPRAEVDDHAVGGCRASGNTSQLTTVPTRMSTAKNCAARSPPTQHLSTHAWQCIGTPILARDTWPGSEGTSSRACAASP